MPPHLRGPLKMTILIDSFRPNYDLSAAGMRWMKSWCNWGIGLKPCWRSWRRTELGVFFSPCMCVCVFVSVCFLGADGFGASVPETGAVNFWYRPQKYCCHSRSWDASGQYWTTRSVWQAQSVCAVFLCLFSLYPNSRQSYFRSLEFIRVYSCTVVTSVSVRCVILFILSFCFISFPLFIFYSTTIIENLVLNVFNPKPPT